jgi:hypothetical protein
MLVVIDDKAVTNCRIVLEFSHLVWTLFKEEKKQTHCHFFLDFLFVFQLFLFADSADFLLKINQFQLDCIRMCHLLSSPMNLLPVLLLFSFWLVGYFGRSWSIAGSRRRGSSIRSIAREGARIRGEHRRRARSNSISGSRHSEERYQKGL